MALDPLNSSNLDQLALKGLVRQDGTALSKQSCEQRYTACAVFGNGEVASVNSHVLSV